MSVIPHPEPKQQHYVNRAYLEGFLDPEFERRGESYLWAYLPDKSPFKQRPDRIARRNYYYCFDKENRRQFDVEHTLQKLEDVSLPVLRKLRSQNFDLDPEERVTFAGYVALSYTRVPTFERNINRVTALHTAPKMEEWASVPENLALIARDQSESSGKQVTPEEIRKTLNAGNVIVNQANRGWSLEQMVRIMLALQKIIYEMRWVFLVAETEDDGFLTSDNPVSLFSAPTTDVPGVGFLSSPDTYFTFPISRTICLLCKHSGPVQSVGRVSSVSVRQVNKGAIARADTQLYSPFRSEKVQMLHDAAVLSRGKPKRVMVKKGQIVEE